MNKDNLSKEEQFLLQEYDIRTRQMLHEDKLRYQLVTFIITLSTAVIGGLVYLIKEQSYDISQLKSPIILLNSLFIIIIILFIIIIAKIRKNQLMEMKICDNIREYFYKQNYEYHVINIYIKSKFPIEPNYCNPSQTLLFVYLLSLFNSILIIHLLLMFFSYTNLFYLIGLIIFLFHIGLYKFSVTYNLKS